MPDTVWRTVTLAVSDTAMGTVTGGGLYPDSSVVTISAIPFEGYHFMGWNDGDTQAVRTVMVVSDTAFVASFEANAPDTIVPPDTIWRTVSVVRQLEGADDDESADGYVLGAGIYADGDTVTLTLLTYDYKCPPYFYGWVMAPGDTVFGDECTFVVTSDTTITAYYRQGVSIPELSIFDSRFSIFPNPASKSVTVVVAQPTTLTLLDVTGHEIAKFEIRESRFEFDVSTLPAGVYFLRLADNPTVGKLIKE